MSIFVCIKQVPDTETKIKINNDGSGIDQSSVKWIMNPYDEFAVEEALQKKEAIGAEKIFAVTVGPARSAEVLRTALAMGADEGLHIQTEEDLDSVQISQALAACIKKFGPADFIFTGKLSIDKNNSSVGPQLAALLDIPHSSVVSKLEAKANNFVAERETEAGNKEIVELPKNSLVSANKGLNTPRFVSLPGIMKAKKKPIQILTLDDLGLKSSVGLTKYKKFELPPEKAAVKMLSEANSVQELVKLLKDEAKVL
jgi:electron transfer flavoprotein beta subunit